MAVPLTVIEIPRDFSTPDLLHKSAARLRNIRLKSLQLDPAAFASTYENESQFPQDVWTGRLTNPLARTFVGLHEVQSNNGEHANEEHHIDQEWLGTIVLLGPRPIASTSITASASPWKAFSSRKEQSKPLDEFSAGASVAYHIVGVYVAPEARGRRLGSKLVQAVVAAAEVDGREKLAGSVNVTVMVDDKNPVALRPYENAGFKVVGEDFYEGSGGERDTALVMEQRLAVNP